MQQFAALVWQQLKESSSFWTNFFVIVKWCFKRFLLKCRGFHRIELFQCKVIEVILKFPHSSFLHFVDGFLGKRILVPRVFYVSFARILEKFSSTSEILGKQFLKNLKWKRHERVVSFLRLLLDKVTWYKEGLRCENFSTDHLRHEVLKTHLVKCFIIS